MHSAPGGQNPDSHGGSEAGVSNFGKMLWQGKDLLNCGVI